MQQINNTSAEKLRGGYYTPASIAAFMLRWGVNGNVTDDILEPSCGDGVFLEQLANIGLPFHSIKAIEYDATEAAKADEIELHDKTVVNDDFHHYCMETTERFDLIIGNPPYIRYQFYKPEQQTLAEKIFKRASMKFSKLTNAWVTFIVGSSLLLKEQGKIGFVVPAELLQVSYALQLRQFLSETFNKINIISFERLVFESIQQEVVLLLCEKNATSEHLIEHIEVKDANDLERLDAKRLKCSTKRIDFHSNKWTYYFLDQEEIDFLEKIKAANQPIISNYADVEVGITTGSNNYFTVPRSIVTMYQLENYAKPMVGRSVQVAGTIFTHQDWLCNVNKNAKAHLLVFTPGLCEIGNKGVHNYIMNGEHVGINKGYKTGIRDNWYVIPSIKISDALFIRRNNFFPKLVLNEASAYTTDTMHRVFIHNEVNRAAFIASFYNSISLAFSEIAGRSYGGGVLELMPSEVSSIFFPYNEDNAKLLNTIDIMMRSGNSINEILQITDNAILNRFGYSKYDIALANRIWKKLSSRRLKRGATITSCK